MKVFRDDIWGGLRIKQQMIQPFQKVLQKA
jgi:hypothetical protein